MNAKKGILERLAEGVVVGDGGYVFQLEKRGYLKAGPWTPEASIENPEAVKQLHREFMRAGADVLQALTFYASEDKLKNRGNTTADKFTVKSINAAACKIAREVANEGNALVLGSLSLTPSYIDGKGKAVVQQEFRKQVETFGDVDFLLCELFNNVEEIEWAIEVCKTAGKPIAANMCIGPHGDLDGVSTEQCAIRMVKAGADIIGVNCLFDPMSSLDTIHIMQQALKKAGLKAYFMCQPLGYHTPDASIEGFVQFPEFPFALEPRLVTRWDIHAYARRAYEMGVRYIGGCCGFEAYHIRAIAEELAPERGHLPVGSQKHDMWAAGLKMHIKPYVRERANRQYWENLQPASGRPYSAGMSKPQGCNDSHNHGNKKH